MDKPFFSGHVPGCVRSGLRGFLQLHNCRNDADQLDCADADQNVVRPVERLESEQGNPKQDKGNAKADQLVSEGFIHRRDFLSAVLYRTGQEQNIPPGTANVQQEIRKNAATNEKIFFLSFFPVFEYTVPVKHNIKSFLYGDVSMLPIQEP